MAVPVKPSQIVGGFTYGGTVLDEVRDGGSQDDIPGWKGSPGGAPGQPEPGEPEPGQPELGQPEPGRLEPGQRAPGQPEPGGPPCATWPRFRALVGDEVLLAARPWLSAPDSAVPAGLCLVCRGPAPAGRALCFQCELHRECAQASLADLVVPVAYAIKGGPFAGRLWQYKSARPPRLAREDAGRLLRALLLLFLRDHGPCLWRAAGIRGPTQLAVVPTGRVRPGLHPLRLLVQPYLDVPWAGLAAGSGQECERDLNPARYAAAVRPGARILLLDDTWTTGSSAQSAALALRQAGARTVVTVVLGRHVSQGAAEAAGLGPGPMPYRPDRCAVHAAPDAVPPSAADHRLDP